jgi:anaerobic dimethyl sulfoxide reductase subunit A
LTDASSPEEIASGDPSTALDEHSLRSGHPRNDIVKYPLQAIGHHTLHRVHSTHDNNDWLGEAFPQRVFLNPLDAETRSIRDGDLVRVWNDRGELVLPARVTPRILPGVVDIPQGAWWSPNEAGVDFGGCINMLTSERWTPFAFGTAQHTIMVQIERKEERGKRGSFFFPLFSLRSK